jgi:lipopolysaccharide transport system permease protein
MESTAPLSGSPAPPHLVIEASRGWQLINWRELLHYRDLFYFLIWRDLRVRYSQSVLGIAWAVIQPLFSMLVFTIVFGRLAKVSSDGAPYALFSFVAMVPWSYFANALGDSSGSLAGSQHMLSKVYFPRLILPMVGVVSKLVDFVIALGVLALLMVWYRQVPTANVVFLPLLVVMMAAAASGAGMWLSALSVQYRDIRYGMGFAVQLLMYAAPVVYPTSLIPAEWQLAYALNPMVGVIEGFRAALLATHPMPWTWIGMGALSAVGLFLSGCLYFRRMERVFADVA